MYVNMNKNVIYKGKHNNKYIWVLLCVLLLPRKKIKLLLSFLDKYFVNENYILVTGVKG